MGPYQVLSLWARMDLGVMAMKWVLCICQSSSITGTSPSDCLVLYLGHSLWVVLPLWSGAVDISYSPSWLGYRTLVERVFVLSCEFIDSILYGSIRQNIKEKRKNSECLNNNHEPNFDTKMGTPWSKFPSRNLRRVGICTST